LYAHFIPLNVLHHASVPLIAIVSLITGHPITLSVKLAVGLVLSNLYVPLHVDVIPAKSLAHKYNVLDHSVLSVIHDPFVYATPALVQSAALIQIYFAVHIFVSVCVNVIEISVFFHIAEPFLALITGTIVSYVLVIVFDTLFPFVASSFATHALITVLTTHCPLGNTVQLYAVHAHVNPLIVPFVTLTSHEVKLYIVSLHDTLTTYDPLTYVGAVELNVGIGTHVSILMSFADTAVPVFPATSYTNIHTYFPLFVCVLSLHVVVLFA